MENASINHFYGKIKWSATWTGSNTNTVFIMIGGMLTLHHELEVRGMNDKIPKNKNNDYSTESIFERLEFIRSQTGLPLENIGNYTVDPERFKGNIENPIGFAQTPIGIVGPITINGDHANGKFYVPMSTLEGTMTISYNRGCRLISKAGGARVMVLKDAIQRAPVFILANAGKAREFMHFIQTNLDTFKQETMKVTQHGRLVQCECYAVGKAVYTRFEFSTGDAMGMNMITQATANIVVAILRQFPVEDYYLESNMGVDKKPSHINMLHGRGKTVTAEVVIPRHYVNRYLGTTPERIFKLFRYGHMGCTLAGVHGGNLQFANGIAAVFLACGQDMANVAESSTGAGLVEVTDQGDLYYSITLPSLVVATIGRGTALPTQRECLEIMGCFGEGKVLKLAEIIAAVVLAGELSLAGAICHGDWVSSHEKYGRNKPE